MEKVTVEEGPRNVAPLAERFRNSAINLLLACCNSRNSPPVPSYAELQRRCVKMRFYQAILYLKIIFFKLPLVNYFTTIKKVKQKILPIVSVFIMMAGLNLS
jgi:hypothetical protein